MFAGSWKSLVATTLLAIHSANAATTIPTSSSLVFYHGRWDSLPSSWWPSSGFKLAFTVAPKSLTLNVGATASTPPIQVGVRFGSSGEYTTLNLTAGANALPVASLVPSNPTYPLTFDVVSLFEGGEARLELQSIVLDDAAKLTTYTPKKVVLEFIGDSLTAGYLTPRGALDDYAFKVGEAFSAEHNQIAQSGICLHSLPSGCWGNPLGMDQNYFKTQNSAYQWLNGGTTTPWNVSAYGKDLPTHIIIALGTNDQSNNVTSAQFQGTYTTFLKNLRAVYPTQHIFAMSPWGYPYDGGVAPYWESETAAAVSAAQAGGDKKVYLMKGYGWLPYAANNVNYYADGHPTPTGHSIIASSMISWLKTWGLTSGGTTTTTSTSTTTTTTTKTTATTSTSSTSTPGGCTVAKWGQCAGQGYTGCQTCIAGTTCTYSNAWFSQCL